MRVRVAAIIMHEGRVLLVSTRRGRQGYVVPPGGGVEAGESLLEAVVREVQEEAAQAVEAGRLLAYRELMMPDGPCLELYFSARLSEAAADLTSTEGRQIRWVAVHELAARPHFPEQLAALAQMAATEIEGAVFLGRADLRHRADCSEETST